MPTAGRTEVWPCDGPCVCIGMTIGHAFDQLVYGLFGGHCHFNQCRHIYIVNRVTGTMITGVVGFVRGPSPLFGLPCRVFAASAPVKYPPDGMPRKQIQRGLTAHRPPLMPTLDPLRQNNG